MWNISETIYKNLSMAVNDISQKFEICGSLSKIIAMFVNYLLHTLNMITNSIVDNL